MKGYYIQVKYKIGETKFKNKDNDKSTKKLSSPPLKQFASKGVARIPFDLGKKDRHGPRIVQSYISIG